MSLETKCIRCKHHVNDHITVDIGHRRTIGPDDIYYNTEFESRCTALDEKTGTKCECRYLEVK